MAAPICLRALRAAVLHALGMRCCRNTLEKGNAG
jgi:hypothetical protein